MDSQLVYLHDSPPAQAVDNHQIHVLVFGLNSQHIDSGLDDVVKEIMRVKLWVELIQLKQIYIELSLYLALN